MRKREKMLFSASEEMWRSVRATVAVIAFPRTVVTIPEPDIGQGFYKLLLLQEGDLGVFHKIQFLKELENLSETLIHVPCGVGGHVELILGMGLQHLLHRNKPCHCHQMLYIGMKGGDVQGGEAAPAVAHHGVIHSRELMKEENDVFLGRDKKIAVRSPHCYFYYNEPLYR